MVLGQTGRSAYSLIVMLVLAAMLVFAPAVEAQDDSAAAEAATTEAPAGYTPMAPTEGKGMPIDRALDVQTQYSATGDLAIGLHNGLVWVMAIISIFVLALLAWVIIRYNRRANPTSSKTTHNTLIEVVWTIVPALILIGIAYPSIKLLQHQYQSPPQDAVTIKATGYQWYWGYAYPDNGNFEIISNMLSAEDAVARGEPYQLAVDNRMVVPANTPLRIQTTGADVIHSFAVPSLWFKLDSVPGRLNEKMLYINEPGVYYGQCSELCGARHGFMPIAVEALPREEWEAWVLEQGGTIGEPEVAEAATEETVEADAEEGAEAAPAA